MAAVRFKQRAYVLAVGAGGLVLLAFTARGAVLPDPWPTAMLLLGSILLDGFPLPMPGGGAMSLTFGLVLMAQLHFGTVTASLVNVLGNLIGNGLLHRRPWDRALFNAGQFAITTLVAGSAATALGLHPWFRAGSVAAPPLGLVLLYIALYWVINNALVGVALYFDQPHPPRVFLRFFLRWLPVDAVSTAIALGGGMVLIIAYQVYDVMGIGVGIVLFLLVNYLLRLHMRLVEAHHDLQALYDITRGLAGVLALDDAVGWIGRAVEQLAPSDAFAVYLSEDDEVLRLSYADHPQAESLKGRVAGEGAVTRAAATRQPVMEGQEPTLVTDDFRPLHVLAVPLAAEDRLVGCLCLARLHRPYSGRESRLLSILASAMAMAIQNGLVYGRTETLAHTDPMTGLYNYRFFSMRLRDAIRRANTVDEPLSLILIDLDNFSDINNHFGHQTGDAVLCQFATILRASVRHNDLVARYAGDEFVAILPGAKREEAEAVAHRIRDAVMRHRFLDPGGHVVLTLQFSLGVAVYPYDGQTDVDLIAAADRNMYREKHHHRRERA